VRACPDTNSDRFALVDKHTIHDGHKHTAASDRTNEHDVGTTGLRYRHTHASAGAYGRLNYHANTSVAARL